MRIHIEGDIYIQGDGIGYSIVQRSIVQSGKNAGTEFFSSLNKNYSSIQACAEHGLLKMKIADSTATTLRELIDAVNEYREFIRSKIDF